MQEHTKARIVNATVDIILHKGYDATRTRDIAERSGVSEATIFKYFSSKDELLTHIIKDMLDRFTNESKQTIGAILRDFQKKDYVNYTELLKTIIIERMNYFIKEDKLIRIIVREMLINPALKTLFINTIYIGLSNVLDAIIKKGMEAGEFDVKTALKTVKDSIFGLIIYNTVIHSAIDNKVNSIQQMSDILIKSVSA